MKLRFKIVLATLGILAVSSPVQAEQHLAINMGITSRSVVGLSYTVGRNVLNAGLLGFGVTGNGEYLLSPTISYNRYFTDNGWYGIIGYSRTYTSEDVTTYTWVNPPTTFTSETHRVKEWNDGEILLGSGKNFQFEKWGVNIDGGLSFPIGRDDRREAVLTSWLGVGGSYRFKLD